MDKNSWNIDQNNVNYLTSYINKLKKFSYIKERKSIKYLCIDTQHS